MIPFERTRGDFTLSCDPDRLDHEQIYAFLQSSYWARGMPLETLTRALAHSLNFGVYLGAQQIGFARVITDRATFAYLADVFMLEAYRGRGLGDWLIGAILEHPDLQGLRRWLLATADAHRLYARHGFTPLPKPENIMTIHRPNIYQT